MLPPWAFWDLQPNRAKKLQVYARFGLRQPLSPWPSLALPFPRHLVGDSCCLKIHPFSPEWFFLPSLNCSYKESGIRAITAFVSTKVQLFRLPPTSSDHLVAELVRDYPSKQPLPLWSPCQLSWRVTDPALFAASNGASADLDLWDTENATIGFTFRLEQNVMDHQFCPLGGATELASPLFTIAALTQAGVQRRGGICLMDLRSGLITARHYSQSGQGRSIKWSPRHAELLAFIKNDACIDILDKRKFELPLTSLTPLTSLKNTVPNSLSFTHFHNNGRDIIQGFLEKSGHFNLYTWDLDLCSLTKRIRISTTGSKESQFTRISSCQADVPTDFLLLAAVCSASTSGGFLSCFDTSQDRLVWTLFLSSEKQITTLSWRNGHQQCWYGDAHNRRLGAFSPNPSPFLEPGASNEWTDEEDEWNR